MEINTGYDTALVKYLGQKVNSMVTSVTIGIKNVEETLKEGGRRG